MAVKRRGHLTVGPDPIVPHARGLRLADPPLTKQTKFRKTVIARTSRPTAGQRQSTA